MKYSANDKRFLLKLGLRIQQFRKKKGWSQEEFAFESGLDRSYVGGVERGERNISVLNLKKIADVLKVNTSKLFTPH